VTELSEGTSQSPNRRDISNAQTGAILSYRRATRPPRATAPLGLVGKSTPTIRRHADATRRVRDLLSTTLRDQSNDQRSIPSEDELVRAYQVSRNSIRAALTDLQMQGIVDRKRGAGTFRCGPQVLHEVEHLAGLESDVSLGSTSVTYEVKVAELVPAPPGLAQHLELPPLSDAVLLERVTYIGGLPACLRCHWMPGRFKRILDLDLSLPFYELVEIGLEHSVGEGLILIDAVAADNGTAHVLDVPVGSPLLIVENHTRLTDLSILQISYARARGDRAALFTRSYR